MSQLNFTLHCEPDVGVFLFHWGAHIHWGSLTGQMTSSWFDRGVIISSKPHPPPLPSSFTPLTEAKSPPPQTSNYSKSFFFFLLVQNVIDSGNRQVTYDAGLQRNSTGLAPINSSTNAKLHATITAHPPTPCWLPKGSGGHVSSCPETLEGGWQCDWRLVHTHTHAYRHSQPTQIHREAGDLLRFVVLFFLLAQQCIV